MRIFISHSESEKKIADGIRQALAERGFEVWNPDHILPGDNWLLEAGHALERADAVVFLFSPNSVDSPFTRRELQYVISQAKYEGRLIPVRVGTAVAELPWILRSMPVVDATGDSKETAEAIAERLEPSTRRPAKRRVARP